MLTSRIFLRHSQLIKCFKKQTNISSALFIWALPLRKLLFGLWVEALDITLILEWRSLKWNHPRQDPRLVTNTHVPQVLVMIKQHYLEDLSMKVMECTCYVHFTGDRNGLWSFSSHIVRPDFKNTVDKPEAPWSPEAPGSATHEVPLALGPLHIEGKQQERKGGGLGNLCIFPLLFLSHSFLPALLILSSFSCFPSLFFFSSVSFCSYHILSYLYSTASCAVCLSPLTLLSLPPPALFEVIWPGLHVPFSPSFRTLSPYHFLFPVRQLPFFLFLCY